MSDPVPRCREEPVIATLAIVLLGCRVEPSGRLTGAAARRAARAARAFHERAAPLIITSGGIRWGGVVEADALCRELVVSGVPRDRILLERRSASTRQNAQFVARMIREHPGLSLQSTLPELALVTCDWHVPRALFCFRSVGLRAVALPAASPEVTILRRLARTGRETVSGWVDRAVLERAARR